MVEKNDVSIESFSSLQTAKRAVAILLEKKAMDVKMYDVGEDNPLTDFYVNATGRSVSQVAALADEIITKLEKEGRNDAKIEGKRGNSWILVDYGDVIVNVFDREAREFYNLDRLMPAESLRDISDIVDEVDEKFKLNGAEE